MKKTMRRVFAILMTLAIAITAIPMMEVKADEVSPWITDVELKENGQCVDPFPEYNNTITVTASTTIDPAEIDNYKVVARFYYYNAEHVKNEVEIELENITGTGDYSATKNVYNDFTALNSGYRPYVYEMEVVYIEDLEGIEVFDVYELENTFFIASDSIENIHTPPLEQDVLFSFTDQYNDYWNEFTETNCPRLFTIKDLLGDAATPSTSDLGAFLGWRCMENDVLYKADELILVNDTNENAEVQTMQFFAEYEKSYATICANYLDEDGNFAWKEQIVIITDTTTYADLMQYLPTIPANATWKCNGVDDLNAIVSNAEYVDFKVVYDSYDVTVKTIYVVDNGAKQEVKTVETVKNYPKGTKVSDIIAAFTVIPSDASTQYVITGWHDIYGNNYDAISEDEVDIYNHDFVFVADYTDKKIFTYEYNYFSQKETAGVSVEGFYNVFVNENELNTEDEIKNYFANTVLAQLNPIYWDALTFTDWNVYVRNHTNDGYGVSAFVTPAYNNLDKIYLLDLSYSTDEEYYAVKPGQSFTLPTVYNGRYVTWKDADGKVYDGSYTVPADMQPGHVITLEIVLGEEVYIPPITGDATTAIPYVTLLLLGASALLITNKRRNFVR